MKNYWLLSAAAIALAAGSAVAADSPGGSPAPAPMGSAGGPAAGDRPAGSEHHHWTLAEARKHAHERADELDKMTEAQYEAQEARRHDEFVQKWHGMTPEQRQAWKDMKRKAPQAGTATPGGSTGSTPPAAMSPSAGGSN